MVAPASDHGDRGPPRCPTAAVGSRRGVQGFPGLPKGEGSATVGVMDRLRARIAWWLDEPLDRSARDRLAVRAAVGAFLAGASSFVFASAEVGVVLAVEGDRIVVADVAPWSPARAYGLQAGLGGVG